MPLRLLERAAIADKHNAWLLSDMAHISGLVAAGTTSSATLVKTLLQCMSQLETQVVASRCNQRPVNRCHQASEAHGLLQAQEQQQSEREDM